MTLVTSLPAVETPQLLLREIEARDSRTFARFMTQPAYQRHIALKLRNAPEVEAFVRRAIARQGDGGRRLFHLAAEEKMSGEAVGDGFIARQRPGIAEIGWGVHPAMWGMGLGTEIGRALLGLAFERLDARRVWCKVMAPNVASVRLARRIGLRHLRTHPDFPTGGGHSQPVEIFQVTAEQYFEAAY